jgi:MYXO-CTERM domain-containing protein
MRDPGSVTLSPQPDNMSKYDTTTMDNGGVHINSGIPNNAAYLMTMGGTNKTSGIVVSNGIGWENAEQVWYRAATQYFGATSDFKAAADATLTAATDLGLTDSNKATIECAWIAVGVITTPSACRVVVDDGGVVDAGTGDGGGGGMTEASAPDATSRDAGVDNRPGVDVTTRDVSSPDATTTVDAAAPEDATPPPADAGGSGGSAGSSGSGGTGGSVITPQPAAPEMGCSCRVPGEPASTRSSAGLGSALAMMLAYARRRKRRISA